MFMIIIAPEKLAHTKQKSLSRMSPCVQRVQKGNCSDSKLRFYYDVIVDECRLFYFSGCDGNSNNFATRQECEQRCKIGLQFIKSKPKVFNQLICLKVQ